MGQTDCDSRYAHASRASLRGSVQCDLRRASAFSRHFDRFPRYAADSSSECFHNGFFRRESASELRRASPAVDSFGRGEHPSQESIRMIGQHLGDAINLDDVNAGINHRFQPSNTQVPKGHRQVRRTGVRCEGLWYKSDNRRPEEANSSMAAEIIDGSRMARQVHDEVREDVAELKQSTGRNTGLAVVLVGDNPASRSYVKRKEIACEEVGIHTQTITPKGNVSQSELLGIVAELNADDRFHGILVQLPLPQHIESDAVIDSISPTKDVDGLHAENAGLLVQGTPRFVPATPLGVQRILIEYGVETSGANIVILGRSNLVGRPLALLLTQRGQGGDATVTVCHTRTSDLARHTLEADVVVAAAGSPSAVTADMLNSDSVVIDVGVSRVADSSRRSGFRLVGDVDFSSVSRKVAAVTPVPGGVGPMTVAMLMHNVALAHRLHSDG